MDGEGQDLSVVCKSCGSEVSPYITECPYCGNRLRKRAPKLGSREDPARKAERRRQRATRRGPGRAAVERDRSSGRRPVVVIALAVTAVTVSALVRSRLLPMGDLVVYGPLGEQRWKVLTSPFVHLDVTYGFAVIAAFILFGAWVERLLGHAITVIIWLAAGSGGAWLASLDGFNPATGALGPAVAVVTARGFAVLEARRDGEEDDYVGVAVTFVVLMILPALVSGASWLSAAAGLAVGVVAGSAAVVRQRAERNA